MAHPREGTSGSSCSFAKRLEEGDVDLYVDGQLKTSGANLYNPRVSDDGQHYFYGANGRTVIMKDQNALIGSGSAITDFAISANGDSYLFSHYDLQPPYGWTLYYNGGVIAGPGSESLDETYSLSADGQHYVYGLGDNPVTPSGWIVDGNAIADGAYHLVLTDVGQYLYLKDSGGVSNLYLDDALYSVGPAGTTVTELLSNEDASHILICSDLRRQLDGQASPVTPQQLSSPGRQATVYAELRGNTLSIYEVTATP